MTIRGLWYFMHSMQRFIWRNKKEEYKKYYSDAVIYGRGTLPQITEHDLDNWKPNRRVKA